MKNAGSAGDLALPAFSVVTSCYTALPLLETWVLEGE